MTKEQKEHLKRCWDEFPIGIHLLDGCAGAFLMTVIVIGFVAIGA